MILKNLDRTLLLWPRNPDESTIEAAREIESVIGDRIGGILAIEMKPPIKLGETIILNSKDIGFFGRPKRKAANRISGFTASIDLSNKFDLPISALPVMAGVPLRIGKDGSLAGGAYNLIVSGRIGEMLKKNFRIE
jgi:hypothetical protein